MISLQNSETPRSFKIGEIVWAKISGYPFWPAQILGHGQNSEKFLVKFFGEYTKSTLNVASLRKFVENLEEFGAAPTKNRRFLPAVQEALGVVNGENYMQKEKNGEVYVYEKFRESEEMNAMGGDVDIKGKSCINLSSPYTVIPELTKGKSSVEIFNDIDVCFKNYYIILYNKSTSKLKKSKSIIYTYLKYLGKFSFKSNKELFDFYISSSIGEYLEYFNEYLGKYDKELGEVCAKAVRHLHNEFNKD